MITWLLFTIMAPITTVEIYTCAWCGVMLDAMICGKIYQIAEKALDNHRK